MDAQSTRFLSFLSPSSAKFTDDLIDDTIDIFKFLAAKQQNVLSDYAYFDNILTFDDFFN